MAGKTYSDIYATSNTAAIANTDIMILQRADGNTYAYHASALLTYTQQPDEVPVVVMDPTVFTVNSSCLIFANTEHSNVNIVLPVSLPTGTKVTVKSITPAGGAYYVNVTSDQSYRVEGFTSFALGNTSSFSDFKSATYLASNGYFYITSGR